MRTIYCLVFTLGTAGVACDETMHSNFHDLGATPFKHIGEPCQPDVPPTSECGYPPQFYCSISQVCASACSSNADCSDGSVCVGSGDMSVGECRQPADLGDGGHG